MSNENRAAAIAKLVKVAKKHYQPVKPPSNRAVLEHMLYACLLENSDFTSADEAFARLEQYSDWNEVRVSTNQELCELAASLADPLAAIERLKLTLHSIFETHYMFELDFLLKENQGKAIAQLEKYKGVTPFVVAYLVQNSFGGHKIPVCEATLALAETLGLITPKERESGSIPGFERAVPKTKGVEFFSTVHQLAVAFRATPQDKQVLAKLKEISPAALKRFEAEEAVAAKQAKDAKSAAGDSPSSATKAKKKSPPPTATANVSTAEKPSPAAKSGSATPAKKAAAESPKAAGKASPKKSSVPKPPPATAKSKGSVADANSRPKKSSVPTKSAATNKKPR
jgi:endonuclease-3